MWASILGQDDGTNWAFLSIIKAFYIGDGTGVFLFESTTEVDVYMRRW